MSKTRKIARCLIAVCFAFLFLINSVFASYSDSAGYYSCLGGGWNFNTSTGNITSPSSASGTYQLSLINAVSNIFKNTQGIATTNSRLQTIRNDTSAINSNVQGINTRFSTFSSDFLKFGFSDYDSAYISPKNSYLYQIEGRLGVQNGMFFNGFYDYGDGTQLTLSYLLANYPDSFANRLLNSVLDPTERQLREATDDIVQDTFTDGGSFSPFRIDNTRSSLSTLANVPDIFTNFFDAGADIGEIGWALSSENLNFFSVDIYNDLNGISTRKSSFPVFLPDGDYIVGSKEYKDAISQYLIISGGDVR